MRSSEEESDYRKHREARLEARHSRISVRYERRLNKHAKRRDKVLIIEQKKSKRRRILLLARRIKK